MVRALALLLTAFTGFSGLVYEVTWQKYLATLLGSHSEATASRLVATIGPWRRGYSAISRWRCVNCAGGPQSAVTFASSMRTL